MPCVMFYLSNVQCTCKLGRRVDSAAVGKGRRRGEKSAPRFHVNAARRR